MKKTLIQELEEVINLKSKVAKEMLSNPWSERDKHHAMGMLSVLGEVKRVLKRNRNLIS